MDSEPSPTLYINNINEKIKKDAVKKLLYMLFSQYGKVRQIIACKGIKMRGQAWVVFNDTPSAANAFKGKQGFKLYGKELRIQYAKNKSHAVLRREGLPVVKSATVPARPTNKRARDDDDNEADEQEGEGSSRPPAKEARTTNNNAPNKILLAQNLPTEVSQERLTAIFQSTTGFVEVRLVPGGRGIAFIEFENEVQASLALRQFDNFQLTPTQTLQLGFGN